MKKNIKNKNIKSKNVKIIENKNLEAKVTEFEIKDIYIIIFFAVITFLFFREILLQQKFLWLDFMRQYYPFRNFAAVTLSQGILPHWNPYTYGGMPFFADPQTAVFYPLHLLLTIFVTGDKLPFASFTCVFIFHYFMAGVFSYYLARSLDLNKWASVLSGITFMFCGFMVSHAIHETMIIQFTYMPLIFMLYNKALSTTKLSYILLTGLFMGIAILCGHPQITLYMFFTFLLFGLYQIFFKIKETINSQKKIIIKIDIPLFKFIAIAAIPFIIGIMLGAIQLLPTMQLVELSERVKMSYEESLYGSLNYHNLFSLFSPDFFGHSIAAEYGVPYWGHKESTYLYSENCIYVGLSALFFGVLGIIALWKKSIVKFLFVISLFSIIFVLGDNLIIYKFFYNFVPGFDKFRFIGRFGAIVLAFSFSLLGAYGFDYFIKNADSEKVKKFIKYFIVLLSAFIILWLLYQVGLFKEIADAYKDEKFYNNSTLQLLKTVITLLTLLGLVILYKKKTIPQQVSLLFFILLSFADLYVFGSQQNNSSKRPVQFEKQGISTEIKQDYNIELFRIQSKIEEGSPFIYNQGMLGFIFLLDGDTPLSLKDRVPPFRTNELMNIKYTTVYDTVTKNFYSKYNKNYMYRVWMSYNPIVESSLEKVAEILEDTTFDIKTKVIIDQEPEVYINKALMGGGYG